MSHLTEEQFEDILQGRAQVPEHVEQCPQCRASLEEKQALARRVSQAFSSINISPALTGRIRARITAGGRSAAVAPTRSRMILWRTCRSIGPGLAVAAALVVIALVRSSYVDPISRARAAQAALVGIHRINLDSLNELRRDDRAGKHCQCMEGKLGDGTAMPCCQRQLCRCGCQMREFQGQWVPSCIIEEPNTVPVSVVVVPDSPTALGMTASRTTTAGGQAVWQAHCDSCNIVLVPLGEESCCVIGPVPADDLVAVLNAMGK